MTEIGVSSGEATYPISIRDINSSAQFYDIKINNSDELFLFIATKFNDKTTLKSICDIYAIQPHYLLDKRALDIIFKYKYYKSLASPSAPYTNRLWTEAVVVLEFLEEKRLWRTMF